VEIDSLILDLEGRDYVLSVNAYETLKKKCSQDLEAFKYLQERVHDMKISEQGRNKIHEIITLIRMRAEVNQMLGIW
jgi:ribosomal protein S19E (S16A)